MRTNLSAYDKQNYQPGRNKLVIALWYLCNQWLFKSAYFPFYSLKVGILRIFGARIGEGVLIKPEVNIKYPWRLQIGNQVWIGEGVWIDNLADVVIDDNVCLSQGAMLLTGNHDYKGSFFNLITESIHLEAGVWIGAKALVGPGVVARTHAVLCAASVANKELMAYTIYQGNPALPKKKRDIS